MAPAGDNHLRRRDCCGKSRSTCLCRRLPLYRPSEWPRWTSEMEMLLEALSPNNFGLKGIKGDGMLTLALTSFRIKSCRCNPSQSICTSGRSTPMNGRRGSSIRNIGGGIARCLKWRGLCVDSSLRRQSTERVRGWVGG